MQLELVEARMAESGELTASEKKLAEYLLERGCLAEGLERFEPLEHLTALQDRLWLANFVMAEGARDVVELGVWAGMTTMSLALPGVNVFAVDTWEGGDSDSSDRINGLALEIGRAELESQFWLNMGELLFSRVFPIRGDTGEVGQRWFYEVDFVFVDAAHDYYSVKMDLDSWWPHLRAGGIMCGHDYSWQGVQQAVHEKFPDANHARRLGADENLDIWWVRKPKDSA